MHRPVNHLSRFRRCLLCLLLHLLDRLVAGLTACRQRLESCARSAENAAALSSARHEVAPVPQPGAQGAERSGVAESQRRLEDFILRCYDLRYNLLDGSTEIRPKAGAADDAAAVPFVSADRRRINSVVMAARREGIGCWDRDVARVLCSDLAADYHPLRHFMRSLPQWDGRDRVSELARRVSDNALWANGFHRWMLALAAAWAGRPMRGGNAVTPLLVSRRQGLGKSTFCRLLMPPELTAHYVDRFDLAAAARCEQKLAYYGLICLDEFDRYAGRQQAVLKNLLQIAEVSARRPYGTRYERMERTASFIGTSNSFDLLSDPTGSRRFLCVEVRREIDCSPVDHRQLYAQLLCELEAGERTWLTKDEEAAVERSNRRFRRTDAALEAFTRHYRAAAPDEQDGVLRLTATEMYLELTRRYPAAMRGVTAARFARSLVAAGAVRVHTQAGNVYCVKRI